MSKLRLAPQLITWALETYQHLFLSTQATGQVVLPWLLEIPTGKEISGGWGHTPWPDGTRFHILTFPPSNQAGEGDGEER